MFAEKKKSGEGKEGNYLEKEINQRREEERRRRKWRKIFGEGKYYFV